MAIPLTVGELKTRCEILAAHGQDVAKALPDTLRQANDVLRGGVMNLIMTESKSAKNLFDSMKAGFDKARVDGVVALISNPAGYLPPADHMVTAFVESAAVVSKTGSELYKTFREGLTTESPETAVRKAAEPVIEVAVAATTVVKKTAARVRKKAVVKTPKSQD